MLKAIRKNVIVNKVGRFFFSFLIASTSFLKSKILPRWRLSGVISLSIGGQTIKMYNECDDMIVDSIYYGWYDEKAEMELFASLSQSSSVIFDVGANTGFYSVVSAAANKECTVFAFEPYQPNLKRFVKNIGLNNCNNIVPVAVAIGDRVEKIKLTVPSDGRICTINSVSNEFAIKFHSEEVTYIQVEVDMITLDSFFNDRNLKGVDLIKIDVESFEMEVVKGALKLLEKHKPVLFCEIIPDDERMAFFEDVFTDLGYNKYAILSNGVLRLDKMESFPIRTFLFSTKRTKERFYSVGNYAQLVKELK